MAHCVKINYCTTITYDGTSCFDTGSFLIHWMLSSSYVQIPSGEIRGKTLRLSVYDVDKRRVRHSLGHVIVALGDMDLTRGDVMWRDLEAMSQVLRHDLGCSQNTAHYMILSTVDLQILPADVVYRVTQLTVQSLTFISSDRLESKMGSLALKYNTGGLVILP